MSKEGIIERKTTEYANHFRDRKEQVFFRKALSEMYDKAYEKGLNENAKVKNSGRVLFQSGFEAGIQKCLDALPKKNMIINPIHEKDLIGYNQALDEIRTILESLINLNEQTELTKTPQKDKYKCRCGCTDERPHSHLVYGQSCECEKGNLLINPVEDKKV